MDDPKSLLEALLALPVFAKLEDEGRDMLEFEASLGLGLETIPDGMPNRAGYVRFVELEPGQEVIREGDLTTEFAVVLSGEVQSTYVRDEFEPVQHLRYKGGDWFGEVSALSHHPALTTCAAATDIGDNSHVAMLDNRLFVKLRNENVDFLELVDDRYVKDHLALHLGHSTILRDLDLDELHAITEQAEMVRLSNGDVLTNEGDPIDGFYLVRAGALECSQKNGGGKPSILAFYRGNSSFGEHSIATEGAKWPGTCKAVMASEVVKLPRSVFDRLSADGMRTATAAANKVLSEDVAERGQGTTFNDEVHVMLTRQSVKGGQALVIELDKCIRCNVCVESCVAVHKDGIPRISKVGTRVASDEVLITACYHCEVPECMLACEYGAIRRDPQGRVRFEYDNCVGCAECIAGCPYDVIRLVEPFDAGKQRRATWLDRIPLVGRWFGAPAPAAAAPPPEPPPPPEEEAEEAGDEGKGKKKKKKKKKKDGADKARVVSIGGEKSKVDGKAIKCDLCAALPFEACVYNCPTSAIHRRRPETLFLEGGFGRD